MAQKKRIVVNEKSGAEELETGAEELETEQPACAAGVTEAEGDKEELARALAEAERARDEYLDALRRLQAEFENYRRRARRELAEASEIARAEVLTDLLSVLDSLDRALDAAEHHEEGKVLEGVQLTRTLFAELLRKAGIEEVDPRGQAFDPAVHEAMTALPSGEPAGTVIEVLDKGYVLGDRVLRPARVVVSSGPSSVGASVEQPA